MAEEQIKIRIQADAADFKTIMDAVNAKLAETGKTATIVSGSVKILQKELDNTANSFAKVGNAAQSSADKMKSSNQVYTHFALVLQDLPYGFRGIQNNLPALIGDFAGLAGPIYLAGSAIIAFFTAWDMGLFKSKDGVDELKKKTKELRDEIIGSSQSAREQGITLLAYVKIAQDTTETEKVRTEALKKANIIYGEHNEKLTLANINTEKVKKGLDGYIQSLIQLAVAQKYAGQIADNIIEQNKIQADIDEANIRRQKLLEEIRGKQTNKSRDLVDVYNDYYKVLDEIAGLEKNNKTSLDIGTKTMEEHSKAVKKAIELSSEFGKTQKVKEDKPKVSNYYEKDAQATFDYYKDNLFQAEFYFNQLNEIRKNNALMTAIINKASAEELSTIEHTYEQNSLNFHQEIENKKFSIREQSSNRQKQLSEADLRDKKKILDREFQNELDAIQNKLDAELKGHKKEPLKQQEDYKQAIAGYVLMAMQLGLTAEEVDKLQDKINKLNSTAEGAAAAFTPLGDILNNLATNVLVELGTQIGGLLTGAEFSLSGFFGLIADALIKIGTHLVLISQLFLTVDALFASGGALAPFAIPIGIAAIAAGIALKSSLGSSKNDTKKFANGGVISGPTYGLMGEYPGAKSNPEVVAPLDKLKSMIGGVGNGEFVLRGSDLVLALNRSNSSLNLRRGS